MQEGQQQLLISLCSTRLALLCSFSYCTSLPSHSTSVQATFAPPKPRTFSVCLSDKRGGSGDGRQGLSAKLSGGKTQHRTFVQYQDKKRSHQMARTRAECNCCKHRQAVTRKWKREEERKREQSKEDNGDSYGEQCRRSASLTRKQTNNEWTNKASKQLNKGREQSRRPPPPLGRSVPCLTKSQAGSLPMAILASSMGIPSAHFAKPCLHMRARLEWAKDPRCEESDLLVPS